MALDRRAAIPEIYFCGGGPAQSWAPVRSTVGVTSLVKFGDVYAAVPEGLIELLRSGGDDPAVHRPLFERGQKLRIVAGPYASF
jgi:transcriptional antiterminator RfaH